MVGRTQMKKITDVVPHLIEDHLIISLSKKWIGLFSNFPEFEVKIDSNNRLVIISKDRIRRISNEEKTKRERYENNREDNNSR